MVFSSLADGIFDIEQTLEHQRAEGTALAVQDHLDGFLVRYADL